MPPAVGFVKCVALLRPPQLECRCNEALVALLKGRELHQMRAIHEPDLDYAAWEARIARGEG
jgi:hypothetical protein